MGVEVEVKDTGALRLEQKLRGLGQSVTIGVHEDAQSYTDGTSAVEVAAAHEFGSDKTPMRSWLRGYVDSGGQSVIANIAEAQILSIIDIGNEPLSVSVVVGAVAVKGIKDRMVAGLADNETGLVRDLDETGHLLDNIIARPPLGAR